MDGSTSLTPATFNPATGPSLLPRRRVEPFVSILVESSRYVLKTADDMSELEAVMRLRGRVFKEEYGAPVSESGIDMDGFDFQCDHLVIKERATDRVIGTYRLLCSTFTDRFYSETEFNMDAFKASPGVKLELGRACIDPEHRRGAVLNLLWRGIMRYAALTGAEYLFGCSSIKTVDSGEARALYEHLALTGRLSNSWGVRAIGNFIIPGFQEAVACSQDPKNLLPPLLQSYLNAGAEIHGDPALDRDFHCIDLFTILKTASLSRTHEKYTQA